jgi:hypothetical protein
MRCIGQMEPFQPGYDDLRDGKRRCLTSPPTEPNAISAFLRHPFSIAEIEFHKAGSPNFYQPSWGTDAVELPV